ncbi:hypothetical protein Aperf_G00000011740 [Anoplocephala perfoliata]
MQPSGSHVLSFQRSGHSYVKDEKEGIHVSPLILDGCLVDRIEGASSIYDLFKNTVRRQPNDPFLGWHDSLQAPYQWLTYEQVNEKVEACGSGLLELPELARKSVKCVGIYAINCPAWKITEISCWAYGIVIVTLYDTLGQEAVVHICNEAELTVAICDTPERARKLIRFRSAYPELKYIVLISPMGQLEHLRSSAGDDVEIILFNDLLALGSANLKPVFPHGLDDLVIICYTSGTTGVPKGAMITNRNLLGIIAGNHKFMNNYATKNDVLISYLPLAHIFEQYIEIYVAYIGARIGFYSGNITTLIDDMRVLKPSLLGTVPRVLCHIFDTVNQEVAKSPFKKFLLNSAIKAKCYQVDQ